MTREKFKIVSGQPLVVTLEKADGERRKSDYTDDRIEYRYEVSRNGKPGHIYLPTPARNLLVRTRCQAGEDIEILRTGQNGSTQWRINPVSDAREPASAAAPQTKAVARQQAPVEAPKTVHPLEDLLYRCYIVSAHALQRAHRELTAEGFDLEPFNWEDVRASGNSLFIERNKQARGER